MKKKNNLQPLVSVIMPVYNDEKYIDQALESIVNQTYTNLEIVVVDDCSTDTTWQKIQAFAKRDSRIKPFRNKKNSKIVKTLNFAIEQSSGKYLARMDGDDERILDGIEAQVTFMEKHPDVAIVGGISQVCDERMSLLNERHYAETDEKIRKALFRYSPFTHPAIVMRKSMLPEKGYDEKFNWAEDYELYFRMAKNGKLANLNKVVYKIRTHKKSVSRMHARRQEALTLYIRLRAVFEFDYKMSRGDKIYFFLQAATMYLMPTAFRFWLFNGIRRFM